MEGVVETHALYDDTMAGRDEHTFASPIFAIECLGVKKTTGCHTATACRICHLTRQATLQIRLP